jgi:hypothetical protein
VVLVPGPFDCDSRIPRPHCWPLNSLTENIKATTEPASAVLTPITGRGKHQPFSSYVYTHKLLLRQTIPGTDTYHLVIRTHCERVAKPSRESLREPPKTLRSMVGQWVKPPGVTTSSHMLNDIRNKHKLPTNDAEQDHITGNLTTKKRNRMAPETAETSMCARYWLKFPELTDHDWCEAKRKEQAKLAKLKEQKARSLTHPPAGCGTEEDRDWYGTDEDYGEGSGGGGGGGSGTDGGSGRDSGTAAVLRAQKTTVLHCRLFPAMNKRLFAAALDARHR